MTEIQQKALNLLGKNKYSGRQKNKAEDNNSPQNENDDPPSDMVGQSNLIRFTGANNGRYGFIPVSAHGQ